MTTDTSDRQVLTIVLVFLGALLVLPVALMGAGMLGYGHMWGGGMWDGGMWGGGMWGDGGTAPGWLALLGLGMQLLFLALLVGAGYLGYRAYVGSSGGGDRALEELRLAYARGDLSDEEFESSRAALDRAE